MTGYMKSKNDASLSKWQKILIKNQLGVFIYYYIYKTYILQRTYP